MPFARDLGTAASRYAWPENDRDLTNTGLPGPVKDLAALKAKPNSTCIDGEPAIFKQIWASKTSAKAPGGEGHGARHSGLDHLPPHKTFQCERLLEISRGWAQEQITNRIKHTYDDATTLPT